MTVIWQADITLTSQRAADVAAARAAAVAKAAATRKPPPPAPSLWAKGDPRFVWNATLAQPLLGGCCTCGVVVCGSVGLPSVWHGLFTTVNVHLCPDAQLQVRV